MNNKSKYVKIKRMFSEYDGRTDNGKLKVDCWSDTNDKKPDEVSLNCNTKFMFTKLTLQ